MKRLFGLTVSSLILSVALLAPLPAFAEGQAAAAPHGCTEKAGVHRGGYIHDYIGMYKEHAGELGLTPEQEKALASIDAACTTSCDRLSADIAALEAELSEVLKKDTVDMRAVRIKVKDIHRLKLKLELEHFAMFDKAQRILKPEQRTKCRELCSGDGKAGAMHH